MNRALLDSWSTREQLCLAGAVSCSGDQNWVSVSRNIKLVCGNNSENTRPADWFSQKSCALQYASLLENVETPKRKKRSSEGGVSPATIVETPTESVLRRLTEERIEELKQEIRKDQEEYAKIHAELQRIQSPNLTEETISEMWHEIELEQEAQRIAEMKWENQMREREQRKQEMQRNWRLSSVGTPTTSKQENTAIVDMDVEEIIGVSKPIVPVQQQTAVSPLLSSLLKSPTSTNPPVLTTNTVTSVRTTAPTIIHTLLTSGSIPNPNQPAITLNTDLIPPEKAAKLLTRPISGPPSGDVGAVAQTSLSPSQSAPTLSMLLEKNKTITPSTSQATATEINNSTESICVVADELKKPQEPTDVKQESTDQPSKVENEGNADSDEPDPIEEQQLMEVFKNIGNIELDIDVSAVIDDEEVDFLKGVDEESPTAPVESIDFANKKEEAACETVQSSSAPKEDEKIENEEKNSIVKDLNTDKENSESNVVESVVKIETSSDDSNDNIPLAAVATLEIKERASITPTVEEPDDKKNEESISKAQLEESSLTTCEEGEADKTSENTSKDVKKEEPVSIKTESVDEKQTEADTKENAVPKEEAEEVFEDTTDELQQETSKEKRTDEDNEDEETERFATPIGDEKLIEKEVEPSEKILTADDDSKPDIKPTADADNAVDNTTSETKIEESTQNVASNSLDNNNESTNVELPPPPPSSHISIADTDEDSCTTDNSVNTTNIKREEKVTRHASERATSQTRRSATHDTTVSKPTEDSDSSSGNRISKRSLLSILSNLSSTKSAQTIQSALNDEQTKAKYQKTCYRRLDFQSIKKSIENGSIRGVIDLQRDLLQLAQNVNFLFHVTTPTYKATDAFKHEMQNVREFVFNAHEFETKTEKEAKEIKQASAKQVRTGSRKSLRIS